MKKIGVFVIIIAFAGCQKNGVNDTCIDKSKINQDAMCIQVYKPVCGCDGKTYSNDCMATNSGVASWTEGECPEGNK